MSKHKKIIGKSSITLLVILLLLMLNSVLALATIDLVTPENHVYTNQQNIGFEYYVNLNNITQCTLILNSKPNTTDTNITNQGFNELIANLDMGTHTWSINCDSINSSESSEERIITIDTIEPTVVLITPPNNSLITDDSVDISFIIINTPEENSNCDILLNNSVNKSITAKDSEPTTTTLSSLSNGLYNWKITCYDRANNSETTETRTFTVNIPPETEPEFDISVPKTEYYIGEYGLMTITAPQGTSVKVEVCPNKPGFVECKIPVNGNNIMNYPFQEYLPFTNHEEEYILEAYFNKSGFTEIQTLNYKVKNNIKIDIDIHNNPRIKTPITLEAKASGGVGDLSYTWHLSNGSKINKRILNITYKNKGNYTETVFVKDSYNNTKNKSRTIDVSYAYKIEIAVKDAVAKTAIKGATVEIEDEEKQTDTNGKVYYYLEKGRREIIILKENYSIYLDELNITKDQAFNIYLEPLANKEPVVTLLKPEDKSGITGMTTNLEFKAEHNSTLNCSVYINEDNDGFFMYLGSLKVNNNKDQIFGITELENKTYWWKVECSDDQGNSGISQTWEFTVGEKAYTTALGANQESEEAKTYNDFIKEFEQVLDSFENLPKDEKEIATTLGIIKAVKDTIKILKNTIRDLDSLNYRNDLSEIEKDAEKQNIILKAEEAYQKAPISIEILKSDSFVDYISQEELEALLDEYLKLKDTTEEINKKKILNYLDELQQEVVISTKFKNARITYKDGTRQELTAVIREIKTYNTTEEAFILEVIPKDIAKTTDEVLSLEAFEVVKQDPIIKFKLEGDKTLVYYFEKNINTDLLKNIKTSVFIDPASIDKDKITGFSIKNLKLPKIKSIIFIPVLVILLGGLVFAGIKYDGITTAKYVFYKLHGNKSLHYINVILNDVKDSLDVGNTEKAFELYEEARGAYSQLSTIAKNDVYEKVVETAARIGNYYQATEEKQGIHAIKEMVNNISDLLNNGELHPALEEYKIIETAYNRLDEETKELLHPSLVALGNKIQIIIDEGKYRG